MVDFTKIRKKTISFIIVMMYVIFVIVILKLFVLDFHIVRSDSMLPTVKKNDIILINKLNNIFSSSKVKINDIIVFRDKSNSQKELIKRVRALPEQKVFIKNYNNKINFSLHNDLFTIDTALLPSKNMKINLDRNNINLYIDLIIQEGNSVSVINKKIFINDILTNFYLFKNNYYFVVGDNTDFSLDSRIFGLISENAIIGKPLFKFVKNEGKFEWIQ